MRGLIGRMDSLFCDEGERALSSVLYPPPAFEEATTQAQETALMATDYAQAGIGVISAGMFTFWPKLDSGRVSPRVIVLVSSQRYGPEAC